MSEQLLKKKILIFIDWFLPGYKAGGPVRSMANMVEYLKEEYEFFIYTSNQDHDGEVLKVVCDKWLMFNGAAQVFYSSKPGYGEVKNIIKDIRPDVVYLNSVFSPVFTLAPLFINQFSKSTNIPKVVFAPRGMFQQGALQLKAGKKKVFLKIVKPILFKATNIVWHATDEQEVIDIKTEIGDKAEVKNVGNIPTTIVSDFKIVLPENEIRFVTISLVAEKKNHIYFLDLLRKISIPNAKKVVYDIYGPIKDAEYWENCKAVISELPADIQVNYKGSVKPSEVSKTLQGYHYFVLPTLGENFGHAIFEALVNGVPVLLSDQTPWQNLETKKAGWDIELKAEGKRQKAEDSSLKSEVQSPKVLDRNEDQWEAVLQTITQMEAEEYKEWQRGATKVAKDYVESKNFKKAYRGLLGD